MKIAQNISAVLFDYIPLDYGRFHCGVFFPSAFQPNYCVAINGDDLAYEFATMSEAMDFACAEAILAN